MTIHRRRAVVPLVAELEEMPCDLIMRLDWMRSVTVIITIGSSGAYIEVCPEDLLLMRLVISCLFDSCAEKTLVTEDTARALGLAGVAETLTMKGMSDIRCTPALAKRVWFRLSSVKMSQHDLVGEPIEVDAPTDL
ncbi:hypothetical protein T10_9177 [Trichinella papuae]|uniref:Uncharacterized protein n=1 Tax=Trichinella papuae TaxID=268474 RepID=A0A0V1MXI1_9BILA|nr:hypothetical protein T10_9177 [Trichinella papuae]